MDQKSFQEELKTLTEGKKERRSNTSLVADVMNDIEAALARGVRRETIHQALLNQGVTLTFQGFMSALRAIRRKKREEQADKPKGTAPTSKTEATPPVPSTPLVSAHKATQPPKTPPLEEEDEETRVIQEFKKSIAHLSAVQQGKKMSDFIDKLQENKMSSTTRRWLERTEP
jgi:hypothetical protein